MKLRSSLAGIPVILRLAILSAACAMTLAAPDATPPANLTKVDSAVAEIKALRDAAKFVEARDAVRKAVSQYASEPDAKKLRDMELAIRDQVRDFIKMKADIEQLSARESAARKVAVERLLGEDVGRIVLRQTVRDGTLPAAVAAGKGLAETKDTAGIQAILARAKTEQDVAGAADLIAILPDVCRFVPLAEIPAFAAWAHGKPVPAHVPVKELMRRRAGGALDAAELKPVADLAVGADSPARRGAVEFLALVFKLNAKREPEAYNKLFGEDRHAGLLAAVEKDRTAEDSQLASWATQQWMSLLRIDKDAMAKGLHARWTLDTLGQGQFNDSGPSSRNLNAKNLGGQFLVPGILGKALLCTNENGSVEWGNQGYRELQTNDFTLATWVKVLKYQTTFGDAESLILGSEAGGGRLSGLVLETNGIVHFDLPVMVLPPPPPPPPAPAVDPKKQPQPAGDGKKPQSAGDKDKKRPAPEPPRRPAKRTLEFVHVATAQPLATNRWYHIAASVSRTTNEVTLYVNGEVAGRQAAKGDVVPGDVGGPLRVGAARSQTKERRVSCCFQGIVDDIRVYNRVITDTDAAILFAQGELE